MSWTEESRQGDWNTQPTEGSEVYMHHRTYVQSM
jgi:hypothetical protein